MCNIVAEKLKTVLNIISGPHQKSVQEPTACPTLLTPLAPCTQSNTQGQVGLEPTPPGHTLEPKTKKHISLLKTLMIFLKKPQEQKIQD